MLYQRWKENTVFLLEDRSLSKRAQHAVLLLILVATLVVRLAVIDRPAIERTLWKEIDYIEISKNYIKNGFNFFLPEVTWPAEPPRATTMELPLVPYAAAGLYKLFGFNTYTVRIIPCLSFLALTVFVFLLGRRELGPLAGLSAAVASAIMPLYHTFGNILFSEPTVFACSAGAVYYFACAVDTDRRSHWCLAATLFSLAVAMKLEPLFLLLPILWLAFRRYRFALKLYAKLFFSVASAMVLPFLWYAYAYHLGKTSIDLFAISGGHDRFQTFTLLSEPDWYKTMLLGRLRGDILGGKIGIPIFAIGFITCLLVKRGALFFIYFVAVLIYFGIVAEGQIDAPYRQMNAILPAAVLMGVGVLSVTAGMMAAAQRTLEKPSRGRSKAAAVSLAIAVILFGLHFVNQYDTIINKPKHAMPEEHILAEAIKKHAGPGAKLVMLGEYTIHKGGNDLSPVIYYYSGLQGWTLQKHEWDIGKIEALKNKGAALLGIYKLSREPDSVVFIDKIRQHYPLLFEDREKDLYLFKLT
jgi:4-amino-4-deoxy-L-arabinose transferase-like glycosyltransferase